MLEQRVMMKQANPKREDDAERDSDVSASNDTIEVVTAGALL